MSAGCGTNAVCEQYVESFDFCGCERCGHTRAEHSFAALIRSTQQQADAIGGLGAALGTAWVRKLKAHGLSGETTT